jgi:hypothetical protein
LLHRQLAFDPEPGRAIELRSCGATFGHNPGPFTELDFKSINYDPVLRADPATDLLNLQLGMTWGLSDITLFVDNALDSQPDLQRDVDAPGSSLMYAYTFKPRTIGVRANLRF